MQCDISGGVICISNKSKYLKTEIRYARAVKTNLYNLKSSFKYEGFLQTYSLFHTPCIPPPVGYQNVFIGRRGVRFNRLVYKTFTYMNKILDYTHSHFYYVETGSDWPLCHWHMGPLQGFLTAPQQHATKEYHLESNFSPYNWGDDIIWKILKMREYFPKDAKQQGGCNYVYHTAQEFGKKTIILILKINFKVYYLASCRALF